MRCLLQPPYIYHHLLSIMSLGPVGLYQPLTSKKILSTQLDSTFKCTPPLHTVPELTTEARALLDEAEYDPGFDISFQLNRLEDELRAMRDAMHRVVGPPDSTDVSGVKSVLTKRKAPGSAPATPISDAAILGPKSKLRRDVAEFDVAGGGGQTGTGRSPAGPVNVVPPGVPPLLAHKVPGAHVLTEAQRGQLMALLKCVDM